MKTAPFLQALLSLESNPENSIIQIVIHDLKQGQIPIIKALAGTNIRMSSLMVDTKIKGFRLMPLLKKCEESASANTIYFNHLNDLLRRDDLVIHGW